jgi:Fe-coproporphyrin III synthase
MTVVIREQTGYVKIETLYLQLLYRCNFSCSHCFHGADLKRSERMTQREAGSILSHFASEYSCERVVLLGGEPFLHPEIVGITAEAHRLGFHTAICTNGHEVVRRRLAEMSDTLDQLRVSLDGLSASHDSIRRTGSYEDACTTIRLGVQLGMSVGVTCTVTSTNLHELAELASALEQLGVSELKLHQLRLVGNAEQHPGLAIDDPIAIRQELDKMPKGIAVLLDDDLLSLSGQACTADSAVEDGPNLERIEMSPDGALTMSCKAVGRNANAFAWDFTAETVRYAPNQLDEFSLGIPQVRYVNH